MTYQQDQLRELVEIRSMMERSSKFMSVSGLAGIMAGLYALAGAAIVYIIFDFNPTSVMMDETKYQESIMAFTAVYMVGLLTLFLSLGTALFLSVRKAENKGERAWTATSRRLLMNMAVPLCTGGILILIFISKALIGLIIPSTLIFYGLSLFSASKFTYNEVRSLGVAMVVLGLLATCFISYGLVLWVIGFGIMHIIVGCYIYIKHER